MIALALSASAAQADVHNLEFGGAIETEINRINSDSSGNSSDLFISKIKFNIDAEISDKIDAAIEFEAKKIGTAKQSDLGVAEAELNLDLGNGTLTIAYNSLPFGVYDTEAISDALTESLAETEQAFIMYSTETDSGIQFSGYLFNGDVDDGSDGINDIGISVSVAQDNWTAGADIISNIGDSDSLGDLTNPAVDDDVAGLAVYGSFSTGNLTFMAEHVTALDEFSSGDAAGLEPSATHFEVSMDLGNDQLVALSLSSSDDAEGVIDYENQTAIVYNTSVMEHVGLSVEYVNAEEYNGNKDTGVIAELVVKF